MNKAELVEAIAKVTRQTKAETERTLDAFIDVVTKNVQRKEGVKLVGFGTFGVSERKACDRPQSSNWRRNTNPCEDCTRFQAR